MDEIPPCREPLTPTARRVIASLVILFHAGVGWALVAVSPAKLVVGDVAAMEFRMVSADSASHAAPVIESAPEASRPELTLPREPEMPQPQPPPELATVIEPPPPDLPPPVFSIEAPPQQPPRETKEAKPTPATRPPPPRPPERPKVPAPVKPAETQPQAQPEARPAQTASRPAQSPGPSAPRTVPVSQVGYLVPPSTAYPARSRRAGEQGRVRLLVLVDTGGLPMQINLQTSSGFPLLDEAAINAVRAARFRPYSEGGVPQAVWVVVPIDFVLR